MAGRPMTRQGVTTSTNWTAIVAAIQLSFAVLLGGAAAYQENWYVLSFAAVLAVAGLGTAVLSLGAE